MIPLQSLLDVTLPTPADGQKPDENFNPFPAPCIYVDGFDDSIQVHFVCFVFYFDKF